MWEPVQEVTQRRLLQRRDAPIKITLRVAAMDYTAALGETVIIDSSEIVDSAGNPRSPRCVVTRLRDDKREVELRVMNWSERPAFVAPDTATDYPADSEYAHVCLDTELMADGTVGYVTI
jgi:hypothetical protein